jgi:hypothetical protein
MKRQKEKKEKKRKKPTTTQKTGMNSGTRDR